MIFYLAALQNMPARARGSGAIEGASRWYYFRRVTFPLLMPTTLFVLVNAVINAFRLVDHIIVMTKGGPDNATHAAALLHLRGGFRFWDTSYAAAMTDGAARDPRRRRDRPVPDPRARVHYR